METEPNNAIDDDGYLAEIMFMQANEHVEKARAMRELAWEKMAQLQWTGM